MSIANGAHSSSRVAGLYVFKASRSVRPKLPPHVVGRGRTLTEEHLADAGKKFSLPQTVKYRYSAQQD